MECAGGVLIAIVKTDLALWSEGERLLAEMKVASQGLGQNPKHAHVHTHTHTPTLPIAHASVAGTAVGLISQVSRAKTSLTYCLII